MLNKHLWINELGLTVVPVRGVTLDYCCGPRVAMEVSLGISCRMAGPGVSRFSGPKLFATAVSLSQKCFYVRQNSCLCNQCSSSEEIADISSVRYTKLDILGPLGRAVTAPDFAHAKDEIPAPVWFQERGSSSPLRKRDSRAARIIYS